MSTKVAVDTLPEFEGLVLRASALMLEGKAHKAKGELFESAVSWVKAGRACSELATSLLEAGYVKEAAEDFLNSANCFLEAGDPRPADRVLERFDKPGDLRRELKKNKHLVNAHHTTSKRFGPCSQRLEQTLVELRQQMGDPNAAHKLSIRWLDRTLAAMPGVPDFHWFAAQKFASMQDYVRTDDHLRWCVLLNPERRLFWVMRIHHLMQAKQHRESVRVSDDAVRHHPDDARVRWIAGWAKVRFVIDASGPKSMLSKAKEHLERAVSLAQLNERETVATLCSIALCLWEQHRKDEANDVLRHTVQKYPVPSGELAWRMLHAKSARDRRTVMQDVPEIMIASAA